MKKFVIAFLAAVAALFVVAACVDSCNRHRDTRPCFQSR
jgi:hypothetical protein